MAMPKARGEVVAWDQITQRASLQYANGTPIVLDVNTLHRSELLRLMAYCFPGSGHWMSTSKEDMIRAAIDGDASLRKEHSNVSGIDSRPITPRMRYFLERRGENVDNMVYSEARKLIGEYKAKEEAERQGDMADVADNADQVADNADATEVASGRGGDIEGDANVVAQGEQQAQGADEGADEGEGEQDATQDDAAGDAPSPSEQDGNEGGDGQSEDGQSEQDGDGQSEQAESNLTIDMMVAAIAKQVADQTQGPIDETRVREIVKEEIRPVKDAVDGFGGSLDAMLEMVVNQAPAVTHVHLASGDVYEVPGQQHKCFKDLLDLVDLRIHAYLVGPAGTGKTTAAKQVSQALGLKCYAMSCNPQTTASEIFGFVDANGVFRESAFCQAWREGGVFVLDEVDNGNAGVLSAFNLALSSDELTYRDGSVIKKHDDFVVIACANTYGSGANAQYVGRNMLDGAFLDRFVMLMVDIDESIETACVEAILGQGSAANKWLVTVRAMRLNAEAHGLKVIISPRASIDGAKLLKRGWRGKKVIDCKVIKGATADQRKKILEGVNVNV